MKNDKIDKLVRKVAFEFYYDEENGVTSEEECMKGLENEWGKLGLRGYGIFCSDDTENLEHIERIDELDVYANDIEAAKQAQKDGIKLIPYVEQPKFGDFKYYRYIDTVENREKIKKIIDDYKKGRGLL